MGDGHPVLHGVNLKELNMKPGFKKPSAPVSSSSAPKSEANNPPSKPTHSLKYKGEDGKYVTICNLFTNVSKTGETYLKGKGEDGTAFFIMTRSEKKED